MFDYRRRIIYVLASHWAKKRVHSLYNLTVVTFNIVLLFLKTTLKTELNVILLRSLKSILFSVPTYIALGPCLVRSKSNFSNVIL